MVLLQGVWMESALTTEWKLVSWKSSDIMLSNIPCSDEKGSSNPGSFFTILKSKEECSMTRKYCERNTRKPTNYRPTEVIEFYMTDLLFAHEREHRLLWNNYHHWPIGGCKLTYYNPNLERWKYIIIIKPT